MKPFDLERALAGDPVVTRDGREVTQLTHFNVVDTTDPLVGVINGCLKSWKLKGTYFSEDGSPADLFMKSIRREGWINIYPKSGHSHYSVAVVGGDVYATKEIAQSFSGTNCIGCVRVEWEE